MSDKGLGRIPFTDPRRGLHLMRRRLQRDTIVLPDHKIHKRGDTLDQGSEGACVGFGWTAWENAKPYGYKVQQDNEFARIWYKDAQRIDPWPGEDYSGTSVQAGAEIALQRGYISEYLWAGSVEEIDAWLLTRGPVVFGSYWFNSMDDVGERGWINVDPTSGIRGGHAYLVFGKGPKGHYWCQNSWGEGYADGGVFYLNPKSFHTLVAQGDLEACTALQEVAA